MWLHQLLFSGQIPWNQGNVALPVLVGLILWSKQKCQGYQNALMTAGNRSRLDVPVAVESRNRQIVLAAVGSRNRPDVPIAVGSRNRPDISAAAGSRNRPDIPVAVGSCGRQIVPAAAGIRGLWAIP